jgi:hypothetical protein
MGDRGNICVKSSTDSENAVFIYSHWGGRRLPKILQEALSHGERWDDHAYLTRIIADHVSEDAAEFTGMGISTEVMDNGRDLLRVDCDEGKVEIVPLSWDFNEDEPLSKEAEKSYTFDEFIELDEKELDGLI